MKIEITHCTILLEDGTSAASLHRHSRSNKINIEIEIEPTPEQWEILKGKISKCYEMMFKPPQEDTSGWVSSESPFVKIPDSDTYVEVKLRGGTLVRRFARDFSWSHFGGSSDIVAYRILPKEDN